MPVAAPDITAIIFDCDGVLVDSEAVSLEIERDLLAKHGLTYEPAEYQRRFLGTTYSAFFSELSKDALERTGKDLPADFSERFWRALRGAYEQRLTAIEGALETIAAISLPKAVASSSLTELLNFKLAKVGLKSHFLPHIYSSEFVKRGKPAPDLFFYASERIGATPETALVIEDSANGILAAKAAGMIAAGFTAGGHCLPGHENTLTKAGADLIFASFAELDAFLARAR